MKKSICLNMIVKNESRSIARALSSLQPLFSYWIIVDTGSTDGTQTIIREFLKNTPGELHERPWRDFANNRNEAIALARGKGDYLLFIDADDVLQHPPNFVLPPLEKDCYFCWRSSAGVDSLRPFLVKNSLEWHYEGAIHEELLLPEERSYDTIAELFIIRNAMNDGARSRDPESALKDAQLLEKAPETARNCFYLAQSYFAAELYEKAIAQYEKRIALHESEEEIYWSLVQIGACQEKLQKNPCDSYKRAHEYRKSRIEALYFLAKAYRRAGDVKAAFKAAETALHTPFTEDTQFIATWMYLYGLLLEYAECALAAGKHKEAREAAEKGLLVAGLPFVARIAFDKILRLVA